MTICQWLQQKDSIHSVHRSIAFSIEQYYCKNTDRREVMGLGSQFDAFSFFVRTNLWISADHIYNVQLNNYEKKFFLHIMSFCPNIQIIWCIWSSMWYVTCITRFEIVHSSDEMCSMLSIYFMAWEYTR